MYIKLGENIINLDLIRKISKISAHVVDKNKTKPSYYTELDEENEARWLKMIADKTDKYAQTQRMAYVFKIHYLNEQGYDSVDCGEDKEKAEIALEKLSELLNNNTPIIHEIKIG